MVGPIVAEPVEAKSITDLTTGKKQGRKLRGVWGCDTPQSTNNLDWQGKSP